MAHGTYDNKGALAFFQKRFFTLLSGTVLVFVLAGFLFLNASEQMGETSFPRAVHIGEITYVLEIAATDLERARGLGGRDSLCETCGMLFVFGQPGWHAFWMKDMRFPIDIVWMLGDRVVFVARDASPDLEGTLDPAVSADRVIELPAGAARSLDVGEAVRFSY